MIITEIEDRITDIIHHDNHDEFIYDFLSIYDFPMMTPIKAIISSMLTQPHHHKLWINVCNQFWIALRFIAVVMLESQLTSTPLIQMGIKV